MKGRLFCQDAQFLLQDGHHQVAVQRVRLHETAVGKVVPRLDADDGGLVVQRMAQAVGEISAIAARQNPRILQVDDLLSDAVWRLMIVSRPDPYKTIRRHRTIDVLAIWKIRPIFADLTETECLIKCLIKL